MIFSMICMKNASLFVRLNGSVSQSPFGQANGASVCPVFALPSTMAPVPGNIVRTVMSALDASEPAMVCQPAGCRARYHSQPSLNDMSSTAAPGFAYLTLPVTARTCHVLPTPVKHTVLEFLLQDYDCPSKPALLLGFKSGFRIHSSIGSDPLKGRQGTAGAANARSGQGVASYSLAALGKASIATIDQANTPGARARYRSNWRQFVSFCRHVKEGTQQFLPASPLL